MKQAAHPEHAAAAHGHEEELVNRKVQDGIGLLTAAVIYGAGIGGHFAILFAFAYGRLGRFGRVPPQPCWQPLAARLMDQTGRGTDSAP